MACRVLKNLEQKYASSGPMPIRGATRLFSTACKYVGAMTHLVYKSISHESVRINWVMTYTTTLFIAEHCFGHFPAIQRVRASHSSIYIPPNTRTTVVS